MATPCIPFNIRPLDCDTDSITVCTITPIQVAVSLDCATDSVTICPPASGSIPVGLDDASLAALETVTVLQGTNPWVVSAAIDLDCATDSVTTCPQASATAVNLSAATIPAGVAIATRPGDWAINHAPATDVRATVSKAPVVGARHVATAVVFGVVTTTTAPTAATLTVTLRDGASGAGTVLMVWRVRVAANTNDLSLKHVALAGLNVVGSVNTAMTLEFDIGNLNTIEDVNLTGYTVV